MLEVRKSESQSPYGAMWFATASKSPTERGLGYAVAIPLRGYVVCNQLQKDLYGRKTRMSQSPYGAMWFATSPRKAHAGPSRAGRNPLTGLCGLQRDEAIPVVF